ncbi:MAG: hypothetical protein ACR2P1_14895, partial [Pseudomonadales bacterium]
AIEWLDVISDGRRSRTGVFGYRVKIRSCYISMGRAGYWFNIAHGAGLFVLVFVLPGMGVVRRILQFN